MAVSFFQAQSTAGGASAGARTLLLTATAGAAVVVYTLANSTVSLSAMAAGTLPMTRSLLVSAGGVIQELWVLSNAPSGILTISAIPVGANTTRWCMAAAAYTGVRTIGGSPFGTPTGGTATAATTNLSVSATTTGVVSFGFGISANTSLVVNNGNTRASATASTGVRLVIGDIAGAATVSVSATAGAGTPVWGRIGIPLIASDTPATTIAFDNVAVTGTVASANTLGFILTATAGAVLLAFINSDSGAPMTFSAVVAGASNMTLLGAADYSSGGRTEIWGLTSPAAGAITISARGIDGLTGAFNLAAITYVGQRTTATPFGGVGTAGSAGGTSITLSVSSTAGNVVVIGIGTRMFDPISFSVADGVTSRIQRATFPGLFVGDTIGAPAVTAIARAPSAVAWGSVGINLIQSGPAAFISANIAMTDVADTFSASAQVRVTARLSATDAPDTFSASAKVRIVANLIATDPADTFSASAKVRITARLSATEAFTDTFASTASVRVTARLSATDATDTFVANAQNRITARLSATDAPDLFSCSAFLVNPNAVNATIAFTDVADLFSASAQVRITAVFTATDPADTFAATATLVPDSAVAAVVVRDSGAGAGYQQAGHDYWDAREAYLRDLYPELEEPDLIVAPPHSVEVPNTVPSPVNPMMLVQYRAARIRTIESLDTAPDLRSLYERGERLRRINAAIRAQQEADAIAMAAARQHFNELGKRRERRRLLKKAKIKAVATMAYALAQTLWFPPPK